MELYLNNQSFILTEVLHADFNAGQGNKYCFFGIDWKEISPQPQFAVLDSVITSDSRYYSALPIAAKEIDCSVDNRWFMFWNDCWYQLDYQYHLYK